MSRSTGAYRGWERRRERDEAVTVNIPADLLPLWERVKGGIRGETPHARFEALMAYAEAHESEAIEAMAEDADRKIEAMLAA